jgi:hypothetical protein
MKLVSIIQAAVKKRPEESLALYVPRHRFYQTLDALNWVEDQRYKIPLENRFKCRPDVLTIYSWPRCSYNAKTARMAVTFMPSPLHEAISSTILHKIISKIYSYPLAAQKKIQTASNEEFFGFTGKYEGSQKTPDLGIQIIDRNGDSELKVVLEIGFAESYQELVQDAHLWLEGMRSVSVVILAKLTESPPFHNPLSTLEERERENLDLPVSSEVKQSSFNLKGKFGPAFFKGLLWVGEITSAYLEIWKRNPGTGLAERCGGRIVSLESFY